MKLIHARFIRICRDDFRGESLWDGGVGAAVERMWRGESSLAKLQEGLRDDDYGRCPAADKMRMIQLIWNAEAPELDADVRASDTSMATFQLAKRERVTGKFKRDLVKFRRIRQLADLQRARHIGPSFDGDTPEEERQHVSRHLLPAYERDGWELTGPVERMYRLLRPIMILPRHRAIARV